MLALTLCYHLEILGHFSQRVPSFHRALGPACYGTGPGAEGRCGE